jgi:predicted enzyme involved in methoxymalonyl-ACP biosynthesis
LTALGARQVVADYIPTPKNGLVAEFLPQHGFVADQDGRFHRDLAATQPAADDVYPIAVELIGKVAAHELV